MKKLKYILSALKPSQYRYFWKLYNNKIDFGKIGEKADIRAIVDKLALDMFEKPEKYERFFEVYQIWEREANSEWNEIKDDETYDIIADFYNDVKEDDYESYEDFEKAWDNRQAELLRNKRYEKEAHRKFETNFWKERRRDLKETLLKAVQDDTHPLYEYIFEAAGKERGHYYSEEVLNTDVKNAYNSIFPKGKNRIYLDVPFIANFQPDKDNYNPNDEVVYALQNILIFYYFFKYKLKSDFNEEHPYYVMTDNEQNKFEVDYALEDDRIWSIYGDELLQHGTIAESNKRHIRLGKIYNYIIKTIQNCTNNPHRKDIVNEINNQYKLITDTIALEKENYNEYQIVISRHPYDIAGMSTDRNWTSCMDLESEEHGDKYNRIIAATIMQAHLIAYLINKNDKNIERPVARMLLKPYVPKGENINFNSDNPNWLLKTSKIYTDGDAKIARYLKPFNTIVQEWINNNWNKKQKGRHGIYERNQYSFREGEDPLDIMY